MIFKNNLKKREEQRQSKDENIKALVEETLKEYNLVTQQDINQARTTRTTKEV